MKSKTSYAAIWTGFLLTFATAWIGLVILPVFNMGQLDAYTQGIQPDPVDPETASLVALGKQVYVENGCLYCHSQQVRPRYAGSDKEYGWGERRTLPSDYIHDKVALLGTMRTGPDLSNIGVRQPVENWHLLHLYNPQITSEGSIMPPFAYLFDKRPIGEQPHPEALMLTGAYAPPEGYEVIPTRKVKALVAYLQSLQKSRQPLDPKLEARLEPDPS